MGSGRAGVTNTGTRFVRDSNPAVREWRRLVVAAAGDASKGRDLLDGPLWLGIRFYFPRPKGHYGTGRNSAKVRESAPRYPATRPDVTKLIRAVEDALTGIVWRDDGQVVSQVAGKFYGEPTRCEVTVVPLLGDRLDRLSAAAAGDEEHVAGVLRMIGDA